jgi:hypothetical protein
MRLRQAKNAYINCARWKMPGPGAGGHDPGKSVRRKGDDGMALAAGEHNHVLDVGIHIGPLVLRVALLAAVPIVAGFALLRGFLPEPGRTARTAVAGVAAGAVFLELMLAGGWDLPTQVVPLLLAAMGAALYLSRTSDPRAERFLRVGPWVFGLTGVFAVVELVRAWVVGGGAAVVMHTGAVLGLTSLAWFAVSRPGIATRVGAAVLAVVLLGSAAQAVVWRAPYPPAPGVAAIHPAVVGAATLDVLVVPNRPGWNLVHVPADGVAVGTDRGQLVPGSTRPGTLGTWAAVQLPAGRSPLWIRSSTGLGVFTTDTRDQGTEAPASLLGTDGPECASALLGRVLAAASLPDRCPADVLTPADATALRQTVGYVAALGVRGITLVTDDSPRSVEAARTVRLAASSAGITIAPVSAPAGPLLVVSGWSAADTALHSITAGGRIPDGGSYLAPWLITAPLLDIRAGSRVPLRFDQSDDLPRRYRDALAAAYPNQSPTVSGYQAWLTAQQLPDTAPVHITQVIPHAAPAATSTTWFRNQTLTPLSGPLSRP